MFLEAAKKAPTGAFFVVCVSQQLPLQTIISLQREQRLELPRRLTAFMLADIGFKCLINTALPAFTFSFEMLYHFRRKAY